MTNSNRALRPREIEELTARIEQLATRVNARFVVDQNKARNFEAATERTQPLSDPSSPEDVR